MNRRTRLFLLLLCVLLTSTSCTRVFRKLRGPIKPCSLATKSDAEKILGQPVLPPFEKIKPENEIPFPLCEYTTSAKSAGFPEGNLTFYILQNEQPRTGEWAKSIMQDTRKQHEGDQLENLSGIGDEAFSFVTKLMWTEHSIWIRKNDTVFGFVLDSDSEKISLDELKALAKRIANQL